MSQTAWNILTAVTVVLLIVLGLYLNRLHKRIRTYSKGFLSPQLRFAYTPQELFPAVQELGHDGHALLKRFGWWFVPMLALVGMAMAVVAHNAAGIQWMRWAMYALTAVGCLFGTVETLCLEFGKIKAASVCGRAKWICFGIWTVGMFAGLFIKSWAL